MFFLFSFSLFYVISADSMDGRFEDNIFKLDPRCLRPSRMV